MIRFTLFGIPVSIHPSLWIILGLLGGLLRVSDVAGLLETVLFIIAGFITLLVHELGHALAGRRMGGGYPQIHLAWLGGVCVNEGAVLTRMQGVLMTAAGPLAGMLPGLLAFLVLCVWTQGLAPGLQVAMFATFGYAGALDLPHGVLFSMPPMSLLFLSYLLGISFWWTVFNLLPVYPLDGGQIMSGLMNSERRMHLISMVCALVLMFVCLVMNFWMMTILLGFMAHFNYKGFRQARY